MADVTQPEAWASTTGETPEVEAGPVPLGRSLARFAPHLLALVFPLNALGFVLTGPHPWWQALLFIVPIYLSVVLDSRSGPEKRPPAAQIASWPFDLLLVVLVALQLANVVLLARMMGQTGSVFSLETVLAMVVVGSSSGYSGIVVAHELIHRPSKLWQSLGRLLLASVIYEHFYTEHVRGHHVRVGTPEDPATARFGESFGKFYIRTVPAQFRSAWRLEAARLGAEGKPFYHPRMLQSRVLHGVIIELAIAATFFVLFGAGALIAHVMQAVWASRALEVVNYFEHWGITRTNRRVLPRDSWDTHSRFTYFALTGLSRHADHHAFASRPYEQLRVWEQSPKLPAGYLAMFPLVLMRNARFQKLMTAELQRRKLGPFAEQT